MRAPVCPYCGHPSALVDSAVIYAGRSYGLVWRCAPCDAHVGCHKNSASHEPLGSLANAALRDLRTQVHRRLDPVWQEGLHTDGLSCGARKRTYAWLAGQLGVSRDDCHVGMFDEARCAQALVFLADIAWGTVRVAEPPPVERDADPL